MSDKFYNIQVRGKLINQLLGEPYETTSFNNIKFQCHPKEWCQLILEKQKNTAHSMTFCEVGSDIKEVVTL